MIQLLQRAMLLLLFTMVACMGGNTMKRCLCSGDLGFIGEETRCQPVPGSPSCCQQSQQPGGEETSTPSDSRENCPGACFIAFNPMPAASLPSAPSTDAPESPAPIAASDDHSAAWIAGNAKKPSGPIKAPDPPRPPLPILFASLLI